MPVRSGFVTRLFLWLAGGLAIACVALAVLIFVFDLRMELDGAARRPIFYFGDREDHYTRIEEERARMEQGAVQSEAPPATEPAAAPEPPPAEPAAASNNYWTDYRGPNRDGRYTQTPILTDWPSDGLPELWRTSVGGGYASMVVAGERVYTIEQRRDQEVLAAYDMATGTEVWANSWDANFQESMGGPGPRATPVWHDGRIYALGAEGEFRVIDAATGETVWRKNIIEENGASNLNWAMAASPLIVEEKVIVQPGGSRGRSIVAYHKDTGDVIWTALNDKQAYASPMIVTLAGRRQILTVSASRAIGLTVEDGELLWDYPWSTSYDVNAAQPVITGEDTFMLSAGYGHGAELIRVSASGDRLQAGQVWKSNRMKNKFASSVFHDGHIYGLDEAILASIDASTGELNWKGGRYGYGQVLLAGEHLVITTERGDVVLVKATPESHQEVARFSAVDGKTWNTPAIDDGLLLVRNTREMVCYRIGE